MKVFLSRVSTEEQSELRQIQNVEGFDKVIIDKCSGLVDFYSLITLPLCFTSLPSIIL